jgi:flagellar assembly factor FliW
VVTDTTRFGKIQIEESELIGMRGSILGFEQHKRFVLLTVEDNTPLMWLQSVEDPAIAFVVINPRIVKPDYAPAISDGDLELLDIQGTEEIALLSIVTLRSDPFRATANLRAPILINAEKRLAKQVILDDSGYPIQHDILGNKADFKSGLSAEERKGGNRPGRFHPSSPAAG